MDYNDNDYEGQNLRVAGEDTSKVSSLLQPFTLPKFDFDDSLHGNFDSLVETEVFLGISSQEDNHWIEDFSRAGNGIQFSSSATEPCSLPRHINVWSEATSSESVEMLLKAVGQEEMVQGEKLMEESDQRDEQGISAKEMQDNLRNDDKMEDTDYGNSLLPPVEDEGSFFRPSQSPGIDDSLHAQGSNFSCCGTLTDDKESDLAVLTGCSNLGMKRTDGSQREIYGTVIASLSNQVQEKSPVLGIVIGNTESSSQTVADSVMESADPDRITDMGLESSTCVTKIVPDNIDGCKEADNTEIHFSIGTSSKMELSKEEGGVDMSVSACGEAASVPEKGESVSTDETCNDVGLDIEPAGSVLGGTAVLSSATEIQQLSEGCITLSESSSISPQGEGKDGFKIENSDVTPAIFGNTQLLPDPTDGVLGGTAVLSSTAEIKQLYEGCITLPESSSISFQGEGIEGFKIESCDATPAICGNTKLIHDPVVQHSDKEKSHFTDEDIFVQQSDKEKSHFADNIFPGSNNSLDSQHSCLEACKLEELSSNPSEKHGPRDIYDIDSSIKSAGSSFAGEWCVRNSVVTDNKDSRDTTAVLNERTADHSGGTSRLITSSNPSCMEVITPVTLHVCEFDPDAPTFDGDDKKLPLDSSDVIEKEVEPFVSSKEVKVELNVTSQPSTSKDYSAFNTAVDDTELASSSAEVKDFIGFNASKPLPAKVENGDLSGETKSRTSEQPSTSAPVERLGADELAQAVESQEVTILDSVAGKTVKTDQSVSLLENSSTSMTGEPSNELDRMMEPSKTELTVLGDGEAAQIMKPLEKEIDRDSEKEFSVLSAGQSTIEPDESNQTAPPESGFTDLSLNEAREQITSPPRNNHGITDEVLMASETSGCNIPTKEEKAITFGTVPLKAQPTRNSMKDLQCPSKSGEGTSSGNEGEALILKEVTDFSSLTPDVGYSSEDLRAPSDRKSRRSSSKSVKGSARKANQVKEKTPVRQNVKGDKSSQFLSPLGTGQLMSFDSNVNPRGPFSIPASSLPDLNTSAHSSALFQQPFTDLQQLQLRAQIIVYGSLIQGAAPDEACMVSAFDGGRNIWEPVWHACVDKFQVGKSRGSISETLVSSCSEMADAKLPDHARRLGLSESEVLSSVTARARNKGAASPAVSSMIPLSSPLWAMSTPSNEILQPSSTAKTAILDYQVVSPMNPYQTPSSRNYVAHTTWASQAPFQKPWLAPTQSSAFDFSTNYPAFPITAPVKLSPINDLPLPITANTKHFSPIHTTHTGVSLVHTTHSGISPAHITDTGTTTDVFAGPSSHDIGKVKVSGELIGDRTTKKRKKTSGPEDALQISATALADTTPAPVVVNQLPKKTSEGSGQISLITGNQIEPMPSPVINSHYSTSVTVATPSMLMQKGSVNQFFSLVPSSNSGDPFQRVDVNIDKEALNIEGFSKVEEAKLQAQEAAAHAAAAITHCESVWSQLDQQINSGLKLDAESKLASAAVAIAAAASVARAAAAAAKIASTAAVQAKQMAEEALAKPGTAKHTEYDTILISNSVNSVTNASPTSILNSGDWKNAPCLALSAAREAARRRIEAASAATRHAENLDAIVKAAELAAEAVSHTGKIVAMVDPLSLSKLVEAGPNNYWKGLQLETAPHLQPNNKNSRKSIDSDGGKVLTLHNSQEGSEKGFKSTNHVLSPVPGELVINVVDDNVMLEKDRTFRPEKDSNALNTGKAAFVGSKPAFHSESVALTGSSIKEGSHVEVLRDCSGSKKAWFLATVMGLKDCEALVRYTDLQSEEGSEQLSEWVSMEAKKDDAPKVRIPHPMTSMQFEGTRKRQRAAVRDYKWSVGDKVDAWLQNCWREGIIAEKNKNDGIVLSVNFPDQGETELVKVWHLRPTLVWNDGQWVESSKSWTSGTSQGDTPPVQKRPKLGSTDIEIEGKGKMANNIDLAELLRNKEPRLPLSANEKVFSIGSTREENRPKIVRGMRSGLEKEPSRVVIGVPKPAKKRKFMEVSKHYVSDRSAKPNVPSDSVKLAKYFAPQGLVPRGPRNNTKVDLKEKQAPEKTRDVKSGKPKGITSVASTRGADSSSSQPDGCDDSVSYHGGKGSASAVENDSGEHITEFGSTSNREETSGAASVFSSQPLSQLNRKKAATRSIMPERQGHGRIPVPTGKSAKSESAEKFFSEVVEPRRSVRRIQPTSRLLEGMQSSQISKFPSSSHDKNHRSRNKGTTRGSNTRG